MYVCMYTQVQLEEMYAQMVYKDHKIIELNTRLTEQDQHVIDLQEHISEKDEVIRGRDMAIQLLQSTIAQHTAKLRDQESLTVRLTAKVERAEIELNAYHDQLESDASEDQKSFAVQIKTIQENFAELLTKKEDRIVELQQQITKLEEKVSSEVVVDGDEVNVMTSSGPLLTDRLQELEAEVERLEESLRNKDRKLASSSEQLRNWESELQRLRSVVASSSDNSLYSTASDMSVEVTGARAFYEDKTSLMSDDMDGKKKDFEVPEMESEKQTDRRVHVMRRRENCVMEVSSTDLERNLASVEDVNSQESDESGLTEDKEVQKPSQEMASLRSLMEAKEAELERLREAVSVASDELIRKEEECTRLTESVAGLNESDDVLKQRLVELEVLCEELRKELMESRDQTAMKDVELVKLSEEIDVHRDQLENKEQHCKELSDLLEESQSVRDEKERLLEVSEQEVTRLNDLMSTLRTSQSELESLVGELRGKIDEGTPGSGEQVGRLLTEVAEAKKLNEELTDLLAEKTRAMEQLSGENDLLRDTVTRHQNIEQELVTQMRETVEKYQNSERELTSRIEILSEDRARDIEKFAADLDLVRAEALEQQERLDGMMKALSEKDGEVSESLREIETLSETVEKYKNTEQELTSHIEMLMEDRAKDVEKFTADLDLARAQVSEKQEKLEGVMQALSEKEGDIAASVSKIVSLTETVYQLQTSLQNKAEENELLRSEILQRDQWLEASPQVLSDKDASIAGSAREIQSLSEVVSRLRNKDQEIELLRSGVEEKDTQVEGLVQALSEKDANIAGTLKEIECLAETVSQLRTSTQSKDEEIDGLRDQISATHRELNRKEEECFKLTASVASLNEFDSVLRRQLAESKSSCEVLRTEFTRCRGQVEANTLELGKLQDEISSGRHELVRKDEGRKQHSLTLEESRHLVVVKEDLVEQSVEDVMALTPEESRHLVVVKEDLVEQSVEDVTEVRRQREETVSLLAEKMTRFEELSQECKLLQDAVEKHKEAECQLIAENERLTVDKEHDLQKLSVELDLLRTAIAEKDRQLEAMIQASSEENVRVAESLKEIASLKETISQLECSSLNKNDEIEKQKCLLEEQQMKIDEQNSEIKRFNQKLEEFDLMKSEFVNQLSVQEDVIKSLKDELTQSEVSCEQSRIELTEAKNHVLGTEAELEQLRAAVMAVRDELGRKEDVCKELTDLLEESQALGLKKDRLLAEKTTRFEVLSQECDLLRETVSKYQNTELEIRTMMESKENDLQKISAELDVVRATAATKEQQVEDMILSLSEKDVSIAETVRECQSSSETLSSLQMSLHDKEQEIDVLKLEAQEKDRQFEGMVQALCERDANIAGSTKEMETLTETVSELQRSLLTKDEQIQQQKLLMEENELKIVEQDSEIKNSYQKLEEQNLLIKEHEMKVVEQDLAINNFYQQFEEHERMKNELVNQLSMQEDVIRSLREELGGSSSQLDDTSGRLQVLEMEMSGKDDKIAELSDVVTGLNESDAVLREQLTKSEALCEELRTELAEVKCQIEEKDTEVDKLQALISASRDELTKREEDLEEITKTVTSLNESSNVLKEQLVESESAREDLRTELTNVRVEAEAKDVELEKLRDEMLAVRDESTQKDEHCKELADLLKESKGLIGQKDGLLANYVQEIEELSSPKESTNTSLSERITRCDELSEECRLLKEMIEKYKISEQELSGQVEVLAEDKESAVKQLGAELQLLQNEMSEKDRQLDDAVREIEELKTEMNVKDERNSQLTESVASLKESADVLRERLAQSEVSCEELRNELAKDKGYIEGKNAELSALQDTVSTGRVELAEKEEECRELSRLLKSGGDQLSELESLKSELMAARDQIEMKEVKLDKLKVEISGSHTELTRKEAECRELGETVASLNESVDLLTRQLAESRSSCEELRNQLTKDGDTIEAQVSDLDKPSQKISAADDQSALRLEDGGGPGMVVEHLLEASSLEVSERLSYTEPSEEYDLSNEEMVSHAYDVVECVRPRYKIPSQAKLGDGSVAEAMKQWTQFSDLVTKIGVELEQAESLTRQYLTVESEEPLSDEHSTALPHKDDSSQPGESSTSLLPVSTLTAMAENVAHIRQCIERHKCKASAEFSETVENLNTQLSEQCRILDERNQELEAARLEIETGTLRFEKLKAKSIAKLKEVSQKHQLAVEEKDVELSDLRRRLLEQEQEVAALTAKLEDVTRDLSEAQHRCVSAHNRVEELDVLLADKNAQIVAVLEQIDGKESTAGVAATSEESPLSPAVVENLTAEEVQGTGNLDSSRLSDTGNDEDVERRTSQMAINADNLRSALFNTGRILGAMLSADDDNASEPPTSCENDFSYVQLYAERCREMIRDLLTTLKLKDSELVAATAELEEKKTLANKYAVAAKKLKQQLDKSKKDSNDISDELKQCQEQVVELTAQLSVLQEQLSQKDGELETSKKDADEKSVELEQCREEMFGLTSQLSMLQEQLLQKDAELAQSEKDSDEINDELKRYREQVMELTSELSVLQEQLSGKETELDKSKEDSVEISDELKQCREGIVELTSQLYALELKLSQKEAELETSKKDGSEISDELKRCQEQILELASGLSQLQEQLSEKETELDKSKKDSNETNDELKLYREQVVELTSRLSVLQEQLLQKDDELTQLQMSLDNKAESQNESVRHLRAEIESLKEAGAQLDAELVSRKTEIEELKAEVDRRGELELSVSQANEELSQLMREKDEEISKLTAEGEKNLAKMAETELRVAQKDAELGKSAAEAEALGAEVVELQQVLKLREDELSQLAAKLVHLELTLETQTAQLDSMSAANQELKNLLNFNDKETGEMMDSQATTMQQLMAELSHVQDKLDKKASELGQVADENRELLQHIGEKEQEIRQSNDSIVALKQETEGLEQEVERQRKELKRCTEEMADLSSVHESDLNALEQSQEQLNALRKELDEKCDLEVELRQKSDEVKAKLHGIGEELSRERLRSENRRSKCEILTAAVREKDEHVNRLSDQLRSVADRVKHYENLISELERQLKESSARQSALESDVTEVRTCHQQLAEAQTALEEKDRELAILRTKTAELTSMGLETADKDTEMDAVEATQSRDNATTKAAASVQTYDLIPTSDEMSALAAQNAELAELNSQMSAELTTIRNRLADLEVENCTLRNASLTAVSSAENVTSSVNTADGAEVYRQAGDGLVVENIVPTVCQLSELGPVGVNLVTELTQGNPENSDLPASDELLSLKEKYSMLESSHTRLKEELLVERQNSSRFWGIEKVKEGLEAENEKNLAQIESLTATKQKMLAKLKQLKTANDGLVGQVEDFKQQLDMKSAEISRMESEMSKLTGSWTVLEDEKRKWLSAEDGYKVALSSLREELVSVERKYEDEVTQRLAEFQAASDAEKSALEQQISSVRDELRSKTVDYESRLSSLGLEKNSLETSLEQVKSDFRGREEVLSQKLADLQTLHEAVLSDTESYQQLLERHSADNARLEELLRTQSGTVDELRSEIKMLSSELAKAKSQKEELEKKCVELVEWQTSEMDSTETESKNVEQIQHDLDSVRNENASLLAEIDGLNWKLQDLNGLEEELSQLQAEMFEVQSENGMLKKRLSSVEKEASARLEAEDRCGRLVEELSEEKRKLEEQVEDLESQVDWLRAQLNDRPSTVKCTDAEVQCGGEERSESLESELQKLREQHSVLEKENVRLQRSSERQSDSNQLEEKDQRLDTQRQDGDKVRKSMAVELDKLKQRNVILEKENSRLKSVVEGMKSSNERLHRKVVACRTGSPRPQSSQSAHRQQASAEMMRLHSYTQSQVSSCSLFHHSPVTLSHLFLPI